MRAQLWATERAKPEPFLVSYITLASSRKVRLASDLCSAPAASTWRNNGRRIDYRPHASCKATSTHSKQAFTAVALSHCTAQLITAATMRAFLLAAAALQAAAAAEVAQVNSAASCDQRQHGVLHGDGGWTAPTAAPLRACPKVLFANASEFGGDRHGVGML